MFITVLCILPKNSTKTSKVVLKIENTSNTHDKAKLNFVFEVSGE
jgi:hypothetical protein